MRFRFASVDSLSKRSIHKLDMFELILGLAMIVAGLLVAIFSAPLERLQHFINSWAFGVELPNEWVRSSLIIFGAVLSLVGLLVSLGILPR